MPKVKDLTHDIGKLRKRNVLPTGDAPMTSPVLPMERKQAFNGSGFFFWLLVFFFLALQAVFLFWLAA